jgi:hypothetical protein
MKTVTKQQFYRKPTLTSKLKAGQELVVTLNGEPDFVVTKATPRRKTTAQLIHEAEEISPGSRSKVDTLKLIQDLRA